MQKIVRGKTNCEWRLPLTFEKKIIPTENYKPLRTLQLYHCITVGKWIRSSYTHCVLLFTFLFIHLADSLVQSCLQSHHGKKSWLCLFSYRDWCQMSKAPANLIALGCLWVMVRICTAAASSYCAFANSLLCEAESLLIWAGSSFDTCRAVRWLWVQVQLVDCLGIQSK